MTWGRGLLGPLSFQPMTTFSQEQRGGTASHPGLLQSLVVVGGWGIPSLPSTPETLSRLQHHFPSAGRLDDFRASLFRLLTSSYHCSVVFSIYALSEMAPLPKAVTILFPSLTLGTSVLSLRRPLPPSICLHTLESSVGRGGRRCQVVRGQ